MSSPQIHYTGELKYQPKVEPNRSNFRQSCKFPYIPSPELVEAVNLAIYLQRPLLLQGEPGCGKTLLARAIADEFGKKNKVEYPFFPWYIKSTTRAKEGLYTYDAVGRLRDAQLVGTDAYKTYFSEEETKKLFERLNNPYAYITWGALGQAFQEEKYSSVILIDEIDKADIDFPNDLLREIEEQKFTITEIGDTITAKQPPIVIITSNSEKELPDAFLRRCIFYYLEFPKNNLIKIVNAHFPELKESQNLITLVVERFLKLRDSGSKKKYSRKPSTCELLDLVKYLQQYPQDKAIEMVKELAENLPLLGALLKTKEDQDYYKHQKLD